MAKALRYEVRQETQAVNLPRATSTLQWVVYRVTPYGDAERSRAVAKYRHRHAADDVAAALNGQRTMEAG